MQTTEPVVLTVNDVSLDIEMEKVQFSYSFGEARPRRGGAALAAGNPQQQIQAVALDYDAITAIQDLILKFESLLPTDVKASYGVLTTAPYTSISNGVAEVIDGPALDSWIASPSFSAAIATYNGNQPHQINLIRFDAILIDELTASAQYVLREEISPGNVQFATAAVIAVKDSDGWKITTHLQHPV